MSYAFDSRLGEQLYQSFIMAADTTYKRYPTAWESLKFIVRPDPWGERVEMIFPIVKLTLLVSLPALLFTKRRRALLEQLASRPDRCAAVASGLAARASA